MSLGRFISPNDRPECRIFQRMTAILQDFTVPSVALAASSRGIVSRAAGHHHGFVTRLVRPHELGDQIKAMVFLDHFDLFPSKQKPLQP